MRKKIVVCLTLVIASISAMGAALPARAQEEAGIDPAGQAAAFPGAKAAPGGRTGPVLLIPESTNDVVGMYDPYDGTYLGVFITNPGSFSTPINAVQGPDGNIYVSDQVADAVFVFDTTGAYQYTYCSGYDNIRGIDFRDGHLFATSTNYVYEFAGPDSFVRNFITSTGSFDIQFLPDGRSLVTYSTSNQIALHDTNGAFLSQVVATSFPEQVQSDPLPPGDYLCATFTTDSILDFDVNGSIYRTVPYNGGRGVYRLGNGNLLATSGSGVQELDSLTGAVLQTENTGSARFIELCNVHTGVSGGPPSPQIGPGFRLEQNAPNPVRGSTDIRFDLPKAGVYELRVYNIDGRMVDSKTGRGQAGPNRIGWNAGKLAAGVYLYQVSSEGQSATRRLVVVR